MEEIFDNLEPFLVPDNDIDKIKEYLFNTAEFYNKEDPYFISELYLKQTLEFLETLKNKTL